MLNNRYLRLIAILILLLNLVNTTGGYVLNSLVESTANSEVAAGRMTVDDRLLFMGEYLGGVYAWVNLLGLLIQMFLVSRIFRFLGVRGALFILPCIALGGYALLVALPLLNIVRFVKIAENSTDYSLMNTFALPSICPRAERPSTRPNRQSIRSSFVSATCCKQPWSSVACS